MLNLKENKIECMREGGQILTDIMKILIKESKPGVSLSKIDKIAENEIKKRNAYPSFKMVKNYKWSICACVNNVVVHGIPDKYILKEGDIFGIDCGVYYKNYHTDSAWTIPIGKINPQYQKFLKKGKEALFKAINKAIPGNYIYDISDEIQNTIESGGYSIAEGLVGHGVGRNLHEEPEIPGIVQNKREKSVRLKEGMTLALEVIYNMGSPDIVYLKDDGWTLGTKDDKISGLFEATVALISHGNILLTYTNKE